MMPTQWCTRTRRFSLEETLIVGVVNVTPDSFSDGGRFLDPGAAVEHGLRLAAAGADLVDVGGESTRPGAEPVDAETELRRVIPVVEGLSGQGVAVSIDTMKPAVAEAALDAGAEVVNDVSGLGDPEMRRVCARHRAGVVVMHMKGNPRTMQIEPRYDDVVAEVAAFLRERAATAIGDGVATEAICLDPGIGFGKTIQHNLELLDRLEELVALGYPVMVGTSRKSFLGKLTGGGSGPERDLATAVTVALAVERGAQLVRVHEVRGAREAALIARAIVRR